MCVVVGVSTWKGRSFQKENYFAIWPPNFIHLVSPKCSQMQFHLCQCFVLFLKHIAHERPTWAIRLAETCGSHHLGFIKRYEYGESVQGQNGLKYKIWACEVRSLLCLFPWCCKVQAICYYEKPSRTHKIPPKEGKLFQSNSTPMTYVIFFILHVWLEVTAYYFFLFV